MASQETDLRHPAVGIASAGIHDGDRPGPDKDDTRTGRRPFDRPCQFLRIQHAVIAQQSRHIFIHWLIIHKPRIPLLHDPSVAHDNDPAGPGKHIRPVVEDFHAGDTQSRRYVFNDILHDLFMNRVEVRIWFVQHQQTRVGEQRARQCDPLPLSPGKLMGHPL